MVKHTGQPGYLQVADDLRHQIRTGALSAGDPLPSTARLAERHECSAAVIKMAVGVLRTEGLVIGQQGKAVFVRDPHQSDEPADGLDALRAELRDLAARVARLEEALGYSAGP